MNRDIMIRIFARGGVAAAAEFARPAKSAKQTGDSLKQTAQASGAGSRQMVNHAGMIARGFAAVAVAATSMGGKVQAGSATAAAGVDQIASSSQKAANSVSAGARQMAAAGRSADQAFADAVTRANRLEAAAKHFEGRKWGLGLSVAANEARHLSGELLHVAQRADTVSRAMARVKGPGPAIGPGGKVRALDDTLGAVQDEAGQYSNVKGGFQAMGGAGLVLTGAAAAGAYGISKGLGLAGQKELELKSIEAFTGDKGTAEQHYKTIDQMSTKSVFNLPDLVSAGKDLDKNKIFSERNLTAADNLAAANKAQGVDPSQVANTLGRLANGDFGEGFQRMRELGINRKDLEAQGLKFDASNQFQGTSAQAMEGVIKAIEAKFGAQAPGSNGKGLSEKLATETMTGALSNLNDAIGRTATTISETLLPAVTWMSRGLTTVAGFFANLSPPVRTLIAWGGVLGVVLLGALGVGLTMVSMLGQAAIGYMALTGALGVNAAATTAQGAAAGTATIGTTSLSTALLTRLVPAMLTGMGVLLLLGVAAYGFSVAVRGAADAAKMSDEQLRKSWGLWGSVWISVEGLFSRIVNHPLFKVLAPGAYLAAKAAGLTTEGQGAGDAADKANLADANKKRRAKGQRELTMQEFQEGAMPEKGVRKISDGDNGEVSGDVAQQPATSAPGAAAPTGTPTLADLQKMQADAQAYQGQAKQFVAQQPATSAQTLSAPAEMGIGISAVAPANFVASASAPTTIEGGAEAVPTVAPSTNIEALQDAIINATDRQKKAALTEQLRMARRARSHQVAAEKQQKQAGSLRSMGEVESRIAALGDGSEDVGNIPALQGQLRAARRQKNTVEAQVLTERIARANDAAQDVRQQDSQQRKADAEGKRARSEQARQWLHQQGVAFQNMVRDGLITKEQAEAKKWQAGETARRFVAGSDAKEPPASVGPRTLGDGSADVGNLDGLKKQLRTAIRQKNSVEAAVLRERIARAQDAGREISSQNAEDRRREAQLKRARADQARLWLHQQNVAIQSQVRSGLISREQASAASWSAKEKARRFVEGGNSPRPMDGSGGLRAAQNGGAEAATTEINPVSPNEARWLGYARRFMAGLPKADAHNYVRGQSQSFERGGFQGEAEMSAFQRAYYEQFGDSDARGYKANFQNDMFGDVKPTRENKNTGTISALTAYLRGGGSLLRLPKKGQAPGAIADAARPVDYSTPVGQASLPTNTTGTEAGATNQEITVNATTKLSGPPAKRILKIFVPDVNIDSPMLAAVHGGRR